MSRKKRFLVFQHMPWEGPGAHLKRAAERLGVHLELVEVWQQPIPDVSSYDGLIVLGGSPNVDQEKEYPFLKAEKIAISKILEANKPYLGFCLGHQLLADVLGARVGPNRCRSVGFIEGQLTQDGRHHPVLQGLPSALALFKWHSQATLAPLPDDVEVLVTSRDCEVEAISVKGRSHFVGLQFDNHAATKLDAATWLEGDRDWLSQPPVVNPAIVLRDAERLESLIGEQFQVLFENFIQLGSQ